MEDTTGLVPTPDNVQQPAVQPAPPMQPMPYAQPAQQAQPVSQAQPPQPVQGAQQAAVPQQPQQSQQPPMQQYPVSSPGGQPFRPPVQAPVGPPKANPLVTIAGILLIAVGVYSLLMWIISFVNFLDILRTSSYLSLSDLLTPSSILGLVTNCALILAGLFALLFSKQSGKSQVLLVFALLAGGLTLIGLGLSVLNFLQLFLDVGLELFEYGTWTILFFIRAPYLVGFLFNCFLDVACIASAVALLLHARSLKNIR